MTINPTVAALAGGMAAWTLVCLCWQAVSYWKSMDDAAPSVETEKHWQRSLLFALTALFCGGATVFAFALAVGP